MQKLDKIITKGLDNSLHQVRREGEFAIYEMMVGNKPTRAPMYEVIHIRHCKEREMFGKVYPEREVYPSSESWGTHGWTATSLERANNLLEEKSQKYLQNKNQQ